MKKYFITSDVHSFYDELQHALNKKNFDINNPDHILCICGDLFDRGPKSKELLKFVQDLGDRFIYIRGNHEDLLQECVDAIVSGKSIGMHHYSNGTVKTICQLAGIAEEEFYYVRISDSTKHIVYNTMKPILDWIFEKSLNYYEIGDYILVHGWLPIIADGLDFMGNYKNPHIAPRDWWDNDINDMWKEARWVNGMKMWKDGAKIPNKTIIAGHFHSSWGWSHIDQKRKEWPPKNYKNWQKSFEPYIKEGIMAIDSCCAYSGFLNCIVLEVEE